MIYNNTVTELLHQFQDSEIYIFGAGYVAELFWEALSRVSLQNKVRGVVVSEIKDKTVFHGFTIIPMNHYVSSPRDLICIAVHESIVNEIKKKLVTYGVENFIWITPFITELSLNSSLVEERMVKIYNLKNNISGHFGIAIRYAAIDQFYHKNQRGFDIYKKGIAVFSSKETAESRLNWFVSLIERVDQKGYVQVPICIDQNNEIIDGEHRFSLAVYHRLREVACRIYNSTNYHKREVYLTEEILRVHGFTDEDIDFLDMITNRMLKQMENIG